MTSRTCNFAATGATIDSTRTALTIPEDFLEEIMAGLQGPKPQLHAIEGGLANLPPAPEWFGAEARREWYRVAPILTERQTLTEFDLSTLESYCLAVGSTRELEEILQNEGFFITSERSGTSRPHPASKLQLAYLSQARSYANELGLTPASRGKAAKVEPKGSTGGFDGLLA